MEMKPGYKQTEVGVIPEEWEAVPLKGKIGIAHGFAFASEHFASHGPFRLATPGHFYEAGGFRDIGEKQKYYVGPVPSDYVLQPGDVIVAMTEQADGLLGSAAVIPNDQGYLHNQRLGRVKVLSSELELDYLVYVFNSPSYRVKVRETAAGTKVKHTSPEKLLAISVRLPPVPEQRAIATALSDVDGLLGGLDRLIAKKRDLKQAAMQQLLTGQTRLPGFQGKWEVKRLGDVATFYKGKGLPKSALSQYGAEPCIHYGELFTRYAETISEILSRTDSSGVTFRSVANDVLMPTSDVTPRGLAKASCVRTDGVILGGDILAIRSDTKLIFGSFLSYLIRYEEDQVLQLVTGSTVFHLYGTDMKKFIFSMPPLPEQTAVAEVLGEMDAELAGLEQRREKTRALKQAMMQELLTGRTRLV